MAYSTAKTNWLDNEIVTLDDFNRIESNIEAAAKSNYVQAILASNEVVSGTGFFEPVMPVSHTSRTGRVKITALVTILNSSGGARTPILSLHRGHVNLLRNKPDALATGTLGSGEYGCYLLQWVTGDAPIGVSTEYGVMLKMASSSVTIRATSIIIVEDT